MSTLGSRAQHWENIVQESDLWKYLPATSSVASNWYATDFNDAAWLEGKGGFGYSDGDDATVISSCNSVYLRRNFTISDKSPFQEIILDIDYDDAFVCYLNGKEVARSSNITAANPVYNSTLTVDHEAVMYRGIAPDRYSLKLSDLIQGNNLLSVQVLNNGIGSSDFSARVFLNARIAGSTILYRVVPYWFVAPIRQGFSNLPFLLIDTHNTPIVDEPKTDGNLKVIDTGGTNSLEDTIYTYNGPIGIEMRGSSSQSYDKKNYAFETRQVDGSNNNVRLLGLRKENDWVLHGPYADKSLMRNAIAYELGNRAGRWAPHSRFCELYINNEYRGVYLLTEKIKVDKNRLDIAALRDTDLVGDQLTGGYILKVDREDPGYFVSLYPDRAGSYSIKFSYVDPKYEDLQQVQRDYIRNYVRDFETNLMKHSLNPEAFLNYADVNSFADYFLSQELAKNVDAYRLSTYFYKDKDSKGGKLTMGPLWDYNFTYGMPDYLDGSFTYDWMLDEQRYGVPFWWDKLLVDNHFISQVKRKWSSMRQNGFSNESLTALVDSFSTLLMDAQVRNFQKFPILSTYVWPNAYVGGTYQNEINYMKNWILGRAAWMDAQILHWVDIYQDLPGLALEKPEIRISPNPFSEKVFLRFKLSASGKVKVRFVNLTGQVVFSDEQFLTPGSQLLEYSTCDIAPGVYLLDMDFNDIRIFTAKVIRN